MNVVLSRQPHALLVPSQALVTGQAESFVYVVKGDGSAEYRPVKVGRSAGSYTVVAAGLMRGETVVTDGQLRLVPGAKVKLKDKDEKETPGGDNRGSARPGKRRGGIG